MKCILRPVAGADQEILERRTRMGAATFPLTDDVVALSDQVCGAPEIEVGERRSEIAHERPDVLHGRGAARAASI